MKRKKTAKKPAKVLKKQSIQSPVQEVIVEQPKQLTDEERQQIRRDAQRLFDVEMFGEIDPTTKTKGLILINERTRHGY